MNITHTELRIPNQNLVNLDLTSLEHYAGISRTNEIITPYTTFPITSAVHHPSIRLLPDGGFVIIDVRTRANEENCFFYDDQGNLERSLYVGDGISELLIFDSKIVVSYFDEGVLEGQIPSREGVTIFDLQGNILYGYNSNHGGLQIIDCYCMCQREKNTVLFFAYTEFVLVELNIQTHEERQIVVPPVLNGSNAITAKGPNIYFHSPYHDRGGIYCWSERHSVVERVGEYEGILRGLEGGMFLETQAKGFNLIVME
ncbi:MAG: hypothetical protein AAFO02_25860 [Bacteroidota bacterium]